jgi:hypothetical protein
VPKFDYDIDRRRAAGRFAPYLDPLMEQLRGSGYGPDSRVTYRAGFVHLAAWCQRQRIRPRELTDDVVDRFARHARGCKCRPLGIGRPRRGPRSQDHARAARRVLQFLRSIGIARPRRRPRTTQLVAGYACWLRERGLAVSTSRHRLRWSGLLMESLGSDPGQYRPADVRHFITVQCRARRYKIATSQSVVAAVRAFLTYLVVVGRCAFRARCPSPARALAALKPPAVPVGPSGGAHDSDPSGRDASRASRSCRLVATRPARSPCGRGHASDPRRRRLGQSTDSHHQQQDEGARLAAATQGCRSGPSRAHPEGPAGDV